MIAHPLLCDNLTIWKPFTHSLTSMPALKQTLPLAMLTLSRPVNYWCTNTEYDEKADVSMQEVLPGFQGLVSASVNAWIPVLRLMQIPMQNNYLEIGGGFGGHLCEFVLSKLVDMSKCTLDIIDVTPSKMNELERETFVMTFKHNLMLTKTNLQCVNVHYVKEYVPFLDNKILNQSKGVIFINAHSFKENALVNIMSTCWTKLSKKGVMIIACDNKAPETMCAASKNFLRMLMMYPESVMKHGRYNLPESTGLLYFLWKA